MEDETATPTTFPPSLKFVSVLGRGTFGDLLLFLDTDVLQHYAVKRIPRLPSNVRKENKVHQNFEFERAVSISDLSVLPPNDHWKDKIYDYIMYEYMPLGSLRTFLEKPTIPEKYDAKACFWKIAADLIQGLHMLHSSSIVHGGIKPENIFRQNTYAFCIGDIGFSKLGRKDTNFYATRSNDLVYTSPEVLLGQNPTAQSDIYSLGLVLIEVAMVLLSYQHKDESTPLFPGTVAQALEALSEVTGVADVTRIVTALFKTAFPTAIPFFFNILKPDPSSRPTTDKLLEDQYIKPALNATVPESEPSSPPSKPCLRCTIAKRKLATLEKKSHKLDAQLERERQWRESQLMTEKQYNTISQPYKALNPQLPTYAEYKEQTLQGYNPEDEEEEEEEDGEEEDYYDEEEEEEEEEEEDYNPRGAYRTSSYRTGRR